MREGDIGENKGEERYVRPCNVSNRKEDGLISCRASPGNHQLCRYQRIGGIGAANYGLRLSPTY
jgi:hypothetical protein